MRSEYVKAGSHVLIDQSNTEAILVANKLIYTSLNIPQGL